VRTGGSWRYVGLRDGEEIARFFGSFHEIRPNQRLVQTFTYEGFPDGVSLDMLTLETLANGRSRATIVSVVDSLAGRDAILASGMDVGVREGYESWTTCSPRSDLAASTQSLRSARIVVHSMSSSARQ
jgi:uncharacterized protein YndB with AHSA1/START domain